MCCVRTTPTFDWPHPFIIQLAALDQKFWGCYSTPKSTALSSHLILCIVVLACNDIPSPLCTTLMDSDRPVSPMYVCPHSQSILYTTPLIFKGSTLSFTPTSSCLRVLFELKAVLISILLHLSIFSLNPLNV